MQNWETALDDLTKLKDIIDGSVSIPYEGLICRFSCLSYKYKIIIRQCFAE